MSDRERLPNRRVSELVDFEHGGRKWTLTVGRFADGRVGEVFLDTPKANAGSREIECSEGNMTMPRGHPGQVKQTGKKSKDPKFGNLGGPGPGRPKGVPNKINRDLKEAYLMAANLAGGREGLVGYLKAQAELVNPSAFMTGLSKLLPSMLEGNPDAPLIVERVYYTREAD